MPLTRARVRELESLATRERREESGLYLAEGVRVLEEALHFERLPAELIFARSRLGDRGHELLDRMGSLGVPLNEASGADVDKIADAKTPQGAIGVFPLPRPELAEILPAAIVSGLLVLDGVSDPGNLGTLIRSALAFGVREVVLSRESADPFAPKVVRATAGAIFGVRVARFELDALLRALDAERYTIWTADAEPDGRGHGGVRLADWARRATASPPFALVIGSEAEGVSVELTARATGRIAVAHESVVESLNAAVAGSILLHALHEARGDADRGSQPRR
jgi:TrmH family RNA methyltransferase